MMCYLILFRCSCKNELTCRCVMYFQHNSQSTAVVLHDFSESCKSSFIVFFAFQIEHKISLQQLAERLGVNFDVVCKLTYYVLN